MSGGKFVGEREGEVAEHLDVLVLERGDALKVLVDELVARGPEMDYCVVEVLGVPERERVEREAEDCRTKLDDTSPCEVLNNQVPQVQSDLDASSVFFGVEGDTVQGGTGGRSRGCSSHGTEQHGDAAVRERLGHDASAAGPEVLTPGEHDHVGAGFVSDRDHVIGRNAEPLKQRDVVVRCGDVAQEELVLPSLYLVRFVIVERRHGRGQVDMQDEKLQPVSVSELDRVI